MAIVTDSLKLQHILAKELAALENIHRQNPDTGANVDSTKTYLGQYTTHLFGMPFQLIDSVDKRFSEVNKNMGAEFMRNFTLNSPILHIKPGMTKYTGGGSGSALLNTLREIYTNKKRAKSDIILENLAKSTIFGKGSKLQKRMYGFQDTYYQYMSYVNYMCRSMAAFLCLTNKGEFNTKRDKKLPYGAFTNNSNQLEPFDSLNWSHYRFLSGVMPMSPSEELSQMAKSSVVGSAVKDAVKWVQNTYKSFTSGDTAKKVSSALASVEDGSAAESLEKQIVGLFSKSTDSTYQALGDSSELEEKIKSNENASTNINDIIVNKANSVMFMVEPVQFEESITNTIEPSMIEGMLDSINTGIGQEIAFITNSNADFGAIEGLIEFLGSTVSTVAESITGITEKVTGGFLGNLMHGAVSSIKGQKMIYPDIYKSSSTEMNYNYTVNLVSPYGDDYNYYMNIIVPLMHLICLAAPKMITANSIGSPFLVQSWIPGICTCQLGMISEMHIVKNPNLRHVSVHGFPLEVKVTFTIRELYNTLPISPANDPASFLFNETLNDYMANLGGLSPSADTYNIQREVTFDALENYVATGEYAQDFLQGAVSGIENFVNPFINSGQ